MDISVKLALLLLFLGLLSAGSARADSEIVQGITVQGDSKFILSTREALKKLEGTARFKMVLRHIGVIRQAERSGMRAYDEPPTYEVGAATWTHSTVWYAGTIAHDACHSMLYDAAKDEAGEPDPDRWTGTEAEKKCLSVQLEVLETIEADPYITAYVRKIQKNPSYHGDPRSWDDYQKRRW